MKMKAMAMVLTLGLLACNNTAKQPASGDQQQAKTAEAQGAKSAETEPVTMEFPPLVAFCVRGLPLFVPFNDGDILEKGYSLKKKPEGYVAMLMGDEVFDITFKEEKNKQLENDEDCINQYLFKSSDKLKGMLFEFGDMGAVDKYLRTHGDMLPEGGIEPLEFTEGVVVSKDYLQSHTLLKTMSTTTEDPDGPEFPASVVGKVEDMIGMKVEKNRVSEVFGNEEYSFGVMTTGKKDNYALGVYVLSKAGDVSICVDTLKADPADGTISWSMADPDYYPEPKVSVVAKGDKGLEIFCSVADEETTNHLWLRQEEPRLKSVHMGNFCQRYE